MRRKRAVHVPHRNIFNQPFMNVLIIEDTQTIGSIMYRLLDTYGYTPHLVGSAQRPLSHVKTYHPSIIIIDSTLEHIDPSELCKKIRLSDRSVFILGLHSKGSWQNKVALLKSGADDCITFPFPGQELLARINALLRRPRQSNLPTITLGSIKIVPDDREAYYNDTPLELSKTEYQLLEYLVKNNNRAISRAELLDHVWDYSRIINSNTVDVHIRKLRQKLTKKHVKTKKTITNNSKFDATKDVYVKDNFTQINPRQKNADLIKTVHGIGYRLDGNIGLGAGENMMKYNVEDKIETPRDVS